MKTDIYQEITNSVVAAIEGGTPPWQRCWDVSKCSSLPLRHNGEPYSGINVLVLWMLGDLRGFTSPYWLTFKQAKKLNACVRKGERSAKVVYASTFTKTVEDDNGEEIEQEIPFMKAYSVFNADQIDGLPESYYPTIDEKPENRIENAERFFANTQATIRHGGDKAFYAPGPDAIGMPPFDAFHDPESYYAVLAHETTHWTRHESRLNRSFGREKWGDAGYAREELVAELGAAFIAADLGISVEPRPDHASYIASWLKVLKNDKRAIFNAASHAQKAVNYLHGLQSETAIAA